MDIKKIYEELEIPLSYSKSYLSISHKEALINLENDANRLFERAKDLIISSVFENYILGKQEHIDSVCSAISSQVEFWLTFGEQMAIADTEINNFSIGDVSMGFGGMGGKRNGAICPRARLYLNQYGLLYRGFSNRSIDREV